MTDREKAIKLLKELISAEIQCVHSNNSQRGLTKTVVNREEKAIQAVFGELTGSRLTAEEMREITQ